MNKSTMCVLRVQLHWSEIDSVCIFRVLWYPLHEVIKLDQAMRKQRVMQVYDALKEKGYNPVGQIVGYILTEDPTYITNHNGARQMISRIDREELLKDLITAYLK